MHYKNWLFFIVIASCFLSNALATELEKSIVAQLDPEQLVGHWYEIARLDHPFEHGLEQVTFYCHAEAKHIYHMVYQGYDSSSHAWQTLHGQIVFGDNVHENNQVSGKLTLLFDNAGRLNFNIIEIDKPYYNYALVYGNDQQLWILSRTPQLTYPIKQHLMAKAKELGFQTDALLFIKQANQVEYESGRHMIPQHD